jgi:hypothetical protein
MSLFVAGDLAWPEADVLAFDELQRLCAHGQMVVNLEGGVLAASAEASSVHNDYKFNLYSHASVIDTLKALKVRACGLANNHISDYVGGIGASKAMLAENAIAAFGTREHPWCEFQIGEQQYVLFAACSPLPEPRRDRQDDEALLFQPAAALTLLHQLRRDFPHATLIAFMHWGYELATFPQPADREWARQAIDAGVNHVIGHHPHVAQGYEVYKHGSIAYSLGNLLLPQVDFRGRKLHYKTPAVCEQLMLELTPAGLRSHWLRYAPQEQRLSYLGAAMAADDEKLRQRTPFAGMDNAQYRRWFAAKGRFGSEGKRAGTVFWSYRGWGRIDSAIKQALLDAKVRVRKLAIRSGLHTPYNW